jgi:hypothetical protein
MARLGVHFALTETEVSELSSFSDEQRRLSHLQESIEERYFADQKQFVAESDKAWDAMHRALSDGKLTWTGGQFPLNHVARRLA